MKWNSLGHREQRQLQKLYDERHEADMPKEPGDFVPPREDERRIISLTGSEDLYVRMDGSSGRHGGTSRGYMRLVGGAEHIHIEIPLEAIDGLIRELFALHKDMKAFDAAVDEHQQQQQQYRDELAAYEAKREADLINALKSGKYTEEDISTKVDEILF